MTDHNKDEHLIEQYLFGELTEAQRLEVEKRLQQDADFAKKMHLEKTAFAALEALGNQDLRSRLELIHEEEVATQPKAKVRRLARPFRLAIAAAVLLLAGFFIWNWWSKVIPEQVFAANYYKVSFDVNRNSENPDIQEFARLYQEDNFTAFLEKYPQFLTKSGTASAKDTLYMGIAHLELNNLNAAKNYFLFLATKSNLKDDGAWYLALAYLKNEEILEAKKWLKTLVEGEISATPNRVEQAKKILNNL